MAKPRIKDVAARAGVSAPTVSVVLNNVVGARVSKETRQRILAAADELGYVTNSVARSLRTRRTQTIGFVSDVIATTPYAGRMIQGAQDAAWKSGYLLLLVDTGGDAELEEHAIGALRQRQVDAIVYALMYHQRVRLPAALRGVPTVVLDGRPDEEAAAPFVVPDEHGGAHAATEELLRAGHRRIGFATEALDIPAARGRLAGYRDALAAAGIDFASELVRATEGTTRGGYEAARGLLDTDRRPTALFCYNDRMAMGAYQAAAELGLRIPDDLSIVGFDNFDIIAPDLVPALTSAELPHYAMGEWAARTAIALVDDPEAGTGGITLPCPLFRRDSVGPPPA